MISKPFDPLTLGDRLVAMLGWEPQEPLTDGPAPMGAGHHRSPPICWWPERPAWARWS